MTNKVGQLKQLGELKTQGVLAEAEFEEQKRRLLA
ncbi:SHOCT domain-containing protein [Streptomyces sp. NPDC101152]